MKGIYMYMIPSRAPTRLLSHPKPLYLALLGVTALLSGCSTQTLNGLGAQEEYHCEAPEGVLCTSVSGVYANAKKGNLPSQQVNRDKIVLTESEAKNYHDAEGEEPGKTETPAPYRVASSANSQRYTPDSGMPLWRESRRLRLWVAPWEDANRDLHDQSYVYVVVDDGEWVIEHNQSQVNPHGKF